MNSSSVKTAFSNTVDQRFIVKPVTVFDIDTINTEILNNITPLIELFRNETSPCAQKLLTREIFLIISKTDVPVQFKKIYYSIAKMIEMYSLVEEEITSCIVFSMIRPRY